jgi:hypothetical protein
MQSLVRREKSESSRQEDGGSQLSALFTVANGVLTSWGQGIERITTGSHEVQTLGETANEKFKERRVFKS